MADLEALSGEVSGFDEAVLPACRLSLGVPCVRLVNPTLSGEHERDGAVPLGVTVKIDVTEDHCCVYEEIGVGSRERPSCVTGRFTR
ncbi:hypothetical protein [Actinomadura hibisca]|uniref:hypothetical protein n=1 Tax=Actinomadura hibisca TaxID=68565 RepID=UPI0012F831B6|nr:hypothetical protein [Actinomadura hibisca]